MTQTAAGRSVRVSAELRAPTRTQYRGPHEPLPDGRCRHRWANRLTRIISGCCEPIRVERDAAIRRAEAAEAELRRWKRESSPAPFSLDAGVPQEERT